MVLDVLLPTAVLLVISEKVNVRRSSNQLQWEVLRPRQSRWGEGSVMMSLLYLCWVCKVCNVWWSEYPATGCVCLCCLRHGGLCFLCTDVLYLTFWAFSSLWTSPISHGLWLAWVVMVLAHHQCISWCRQWQSGVWRPSVHTFDPSMLFTLGLYVGYSTTVIWSERPMGRGDALYVLLWVI